MAYGFLDLASTASVQAAQEAHGSLAFWSGFTGSRKFDRFTETEKKFIANRDSFYIATVSETGWPYVQHRGGPSGFMKVLDDRTLGFVDFRGNRQYITQGNVSADDRAALFLMDYPGQRRLKIYAHVEVKSFADDPALASKLILPEYKGKAERAMLLHLDAFDWNCPQHITPRFTEAEINQAILPLRNRLIDLETEVSHLRAKLAVNKGVET
ncbi:MULTISPECIES: pyridoxamine 5'-phosphate oxidase family protein [Acinetobacter]|uniref:pyridoxamine 5'-phosphate oxidase family protein n=2 Tax=Gammaproteobacteria TaxID=1236 RepID=UPI0012308BB2|nr:pyridoxamine 5'-phosphate oxidase family protein [Acinetobacter soli]